VNPRYPFVAARATHRCEYCLAPEAIFNFPFEVEHIIPLSRGGTDDEANLALACRACNVRKADHLLGLDEARASQSDAPLFDPRRDVWAAHFRVDPDTAGIEARTVIGRGTIARLQMNLELNLTARRQWMRLGLFP
jgi:hypothetical protein